MLRKTGRLLLKPERWGSTEETTPRVWVETAGRRWVEVEAGQQAGAEGAASLTRSCSLFGLHHIHLSDQLPTWPRRRQEVVAEIEDWETDTESPEAGERKKMRVRTGQRYGQWKREEGGEREGGTRATWHSTIYYGSLSLWESPGANDTVKYSEKDQEQKTPAPGDVRQLQCWNNAHCSA